MTGCYLLLDGRRAHRLFASQGAAGCTLGGSCADVRVRRDARPMLAAAVARKMLLELERRKCLPESRSIGGVGRKL